jgi:hypothetical protein
LLSTACRPYRPAANLRNIFRKIMAGAFFTALLAATHPPRKNPALPHEKLLAFSLPQDSPAQLMFGASRFGESVLSASLSLGFHIVPRRFVRRSASANRTSASISTGFSTRRDVSPRHAT